MRLPLRRNQQNKNSDEDAALYLTPAGIQRMRDELARIEKHDAPIAREDVARAIALGDLSENAEYQESKARLARLNARIFTLNDRLRRALPIQNSNATGRISLGSTVTLIKDGVTKIYTLVGPAEANPSRGRISHVSPLGAALMGHAAGEKITLETQNGKINYSILQVA